MLHPPTWRGVLVLLSASLLALSASGARVAQSSPDEDPAELGSAFRALVGTYWTATDRKVRDEAIADLERIFKDNPAGVYGAIVDWGSGYADAPDVETGAVDTTFPLVIPEATTETLDVALYVPTRYTSRRRWPLLAVLPRASEPIADAREAWQQIAEAEGFIVVVPADPNEASDPSWSYDIADRERLAVLKAVAFAGRTYRIDTARVFATGAGRGGFGCWDLALHAPGAFRAMHPVGGAPGLLPLRLSTNLAATRVRCVLGDKDDPLVIHNVAIAQRLTAAIGAPIDVAIRADGDADVAVDPFEIWRFLRDAAGEGGSQGGVQRTAVDETATELRPWRHLALSVSRVDKSSVALPESIEIPGASQMPEKRRRDAVADALQVYRAEVEISWEGSIATVATQHVERFSLLLDPRNLAPTLQEALELDRISVVANGRRPKVERFRWSVRTLLDEMHANPTSPLRPLAKIELRP